MTVSRIVCASITATIALSSLVGCHADRDDDDDDDKKTPAEVARAAKAHAGVLSIEPEMLAGLGLRTTLVTERDLGALARAPAELHVDEDAFAVVSSPLPARVDRVAVSAGDAVKQGQVLVELVSFELARARAELLSARVRRDASRRSAARKRELATAHALAEREAQDAEADAAADDVAVRVAEESLRAFGLADDDIAATSEASGRVSLRAPLSGTVLSRDVLRGAKVEPGQAIVQIADEKKLWLVAHVAEREAVQLKAGASARVGFAALPGRAFEGRVAVVGRAVDDATRTVPVRIVVDNVGGVLRAGMTAEAWLPLSGADAHPVVVVPVVAVQRTAHGWAVFVPAREPGTFEVRAVARGGELSDEVEIVSGLKAGETVVVDGAFLLKAEADKALGRMSDEDH
jgi:cobalt-zinc-cadmium efflux system membrane fusion protein